MIAVSKPRRFWTVETLEAAGCEEFTLRVGPSRLNPDLPVVRVARTDQERWVELPILAAETVLEAMPEKFTTRQIMRVLENTPGAHYA